MNKPKWRSACCDAEMKIDQALIGGAGQEHPGGYILICIKCGKQTTIKQEFDKQEADNN